MKLLLQVLPLLLGFAALAVCSAIYLSDRVNSWIDSFANAKDYVVTWFRPSKGTSDLHGAQLSGGNVLMDGNLRQRTGSALASLGNFPSPGAVMAG